MEKVIVVPLFLALVFSIFVLFKRGLHFFIKLLPALVLALFILFWWSELSGFFISLKSFDSNYGRDWAFQFFNSSFIAIIWVWAFVLLQAVLSDDTKMSLVMILICAFLTLLIWAGYLFTGFHNLR